MGTKTKAPDVLDGMLEHVRYEITKIVHLVRIGNEWCDVLNDDLAKFARESILEAGLIHLRCVIEFLGDDPKSDRVVARDYVPEWVWKISAELNRVGELQGRVAHLGTVRRSVATNGAFDWNAWLYSEAPTVLRGVREFLLRLRTSAPRRFALFVEPDPGLVTAFALD